MKLSFNNKFFVLIALLALTFSNLGITTPVFAATGNIKRVSVDSSGTQGNGTSQYATISADGRYVVFDSSASNLVSGDTNGASDIFVRDTVNNTTARISVDSSGTQGNSDSYYPTISANGRYVVFHSSASNLVSGDTNMVIDIFVRDMVNNTTARVSLDSSGAEGNGDSIYPTISADGRFVAFESDAENLVSGDWNFSSDIFVRDTVNNTTTRISVDSSGAEGDGNSTGATISADGRYVAFHSYASNLVSGDTNAVRDAFVRDTVNNTTARVSLDSSGTQGNGHSSYPTISTDGRYVVFNSSASNLVSGDTNGKYDIFVRDTVNNTTARISVDSSGTQGDGNSIYPTISADGRYVAFHSVASNLVSGDTNAVYDIFVRDTVNNTTARISVDSSGTQGNSTSYFPTFSADGRYVAFQSDASNLVSGDTNAVRDVFVRDTASATSLVNSVLPTSRNAAVGSPVTIFNTVLNAGSSTAIGVTLSMSPAPAGTFTYTPTNCNTNAIIGSPNAAVDIPAGGVACYVLSFTPSAPFSATQVHIQAQASNAPATSLLPGINTWLLRSTASQNPDNIALTTTTDFHQVACSGTNVFAVAMSNVGAAATGDITVTANTGAASLPISVSIQETNPGTGAIIGDNILNNFGAGENRTVAVFVTFNGCISFDPAANRIFIEIRDASNNIVGSTSTAVSTNR